MSADVLAIQVRLTDNTVVQPKTAQTEADRFGAFVRRVIRAYGRRVADRDIEALTGLVALRDEIDAALVDAVRGLHGKPYSWTDIGAALGTTRQAAQMRFGKAIATGDDPR